MKTHKVQAKYHLNYNEAKKLQLNDIIVKKEVERLLMYYKEEINSLDYEINVNVNRDLDALVQFGKGEKSRVKEFINSLRLIIESVNNNYLFCVRDKAKEYAKFKHAEEYNDPAFHRDVLETINDFEAGYKTAIKNIFNEQSE